MDQPELSIIAPLYNEEGNVRLLYKTIADAIEPLELTSEILFIDDGSRDATFEMTKQLAAADPRLRVVKFRKNYGQTAAMAAGIEHASGKILITMDGDLQNDPSDIPLFLDKISEGFDVVVGWRHKRQDKLFTRKIPSNIANWIIGKITGVPIKDNGCSLKAFRATIIKNVPLYSEMHRFIPAMTSLAGARIAEIKVRHHARQFGESKYGLSRIYKVLLDLLVIKTIVSFATRPLVWFGLLSLPVVAVSLVFFFIWLNDLVSTGLAPTVAFSGVSMLFGSLAFFLLACGFIAELICKTRNAELNILPFLTAEDLPVKKPKTIV